MKKCKIIELCDVYDCLHVTPEYQQNGISMVRVSEINNAFLNLHNTMKVSENVYNKHTETYKPQQGDIILARVGAFLGEFAYVDTREKFCIGQNTTILHPKNFELGKYIYYNLISPRTQLRIQREAAGSAYKNVGVEAIKNFEINIPEDNQRAKCIGDVLYEIDKKIDNNIKINHNLEELLTTIYQRWFIEFEFQDDNKKPYKSNGGKFVYNEILKQEIPTGWEVKKIKDIINVVTGKEDANFSSENGEYKFFTCSNNTLRCNEPAFEGSSILIAGNGDFNVKHYTGKFNAYQRTYVLIPDNVDYYCSMYISALNKINSFKKGSNGSIVKFITKGDVENIDVIIPMQKELLKELNSILFNIEQNQNENDKLEELKKFLLPMLMNGQINVADIII